MEQESSSSSPLSKGPPLKRNPFSSLILMGLKGGVTVYRKIISPLFPPTCRFYPTCSAYALESLEKYGPWKGSQLALKRISRCHPWNPGGYDPVP